MWCPVCKTEHLGSKNDCPLYNKAFSLTKSRPLLDFEAFSSPDIFVGRHAYPNIFSGVLSPVDTATDPTPLSFPEEWFKKDLSIAEVLKNRSALVYTRFKPGSSKRLKSVMQEMTLSSKPCSAEFSLDKPPAFNAMESFNAGVIANTASLKTFSLTSNPVVPVPVERAFSDTDVGASDTVFSLYKGGLSNSYLINLFSAGILGLKSERRLVPSRWSTTAVDDILSSRLLSDLKTFEVIDSFQIFSGYYVGNRYVFILMPSKWRFEVIEKKIGSNHFWSDYESVFKRKAYASSVTGAYYVNRLAVCEYLHAIKKQAAVLVLREIDDSYYAPLGVGILRELSRHVFRNKPILAESLSASLTIAAGILETKTEEFVVQSKLLQELKNQTSLLDFFSRK